jgi:PAS domain S-box-containing protein
MSATPGPSARHLPGPELYRAFLGNERSGILFATAEGAIVEANPAACRVLRCAREHLVGRDVRTLFDDGDARVQGALEEWRNAGSFRGELSVRRGPAGADGAEAAAVTFAPYADRAGGAGLVVALRELVESPPPPSANGTTIDTWLADLASDAVVVFDGGGAIKYANRSLESLLGYSPGEMTGVVALHVVHPTDLQRMVGQFAEAWETPGIGRPIEFRIRHRDGHYVPCEASTNNLLDDPRVGGVVVVLRDVSGRVADEEERRRNERLERDVAAQAAQVEELTSELRKSEERFRLAFERSHVGMGEVGPDGHWLRVNPRLAQILGTEPARLERRPVRDVVDPADRAVALERLSLSRASPPGAPPEEQRWLRADGTRVWVAVAVGVAEHADGRAPGRTIVVVVDDIDARKRSEQALESLTPREVEVMRLVAAGRTNREIAEELVTTPRTAKFHVENLIRKLGVADRRTVAERATALGFAAALDAGA